MADNDSDQEENMLWGKQHTDEEKTELKQIITTAYPDNKHRLDDDRLSFLLEWLGNKYRETRLKVLLNLWHNSYFYPCMSTNMAYSKLIDSRDNLIFIIRLSNTISGTISITIRPCDQYRFSHFRLKKIKSQESTKFVPKLSSGQIVFDSFDKSSSSEHIMFDLLDKSFVISLQMFIYNKVKKMYEPAEYELS